MLDSLNNTVNWLNNRGLEAIGEIPLAVVCGSGLAQGVDEYIDKQHVWNYADIPDFPTTTVSGHGGELILGKFKNSGVPVLIFSGRIHLYEGICADELLFQVRLVKALNINNLLLTCSVGSILKQTPPGSLGLITDHIDFQMTMAKEPQVKTGRGLYPIYDRDFCELLLKSALKAGLILTEGVFCSVLGPTYETPAEVNMLRGYGCSWVSMSTTKEACEGKRLGLRIAGITGISNVMKAVHGPAETTHEEVLTASKESSNKLWKLLSETSREIS